MVITKRTSFSRLPWAGTLKTFTWIAPLIWGMHPQTNEHKKDTWVAAGRKLSLKSKCLVQIALNQSTTVFSSTATLMFQYIWISTPDQPTAHFKEARMKKKRQVLFHKWNLLFSNKRKGIHSAVTGLWIPWLLYLLLMQRPTFHWRWTLQQPLLNHKMPLTGP